MNGRPPLQVRVWDELGGDRLIPASLADRTTEIAGLGASLELLHNHPRTPGVCPVCGLSQAQYDETGFVGCGLCYTVFVENEADGAIAAE